jgi:hypothetical protein
VLTIPAGVTLTNTGNTTVGANSSSGVFTTLSMTGGGALVANGTVTVGQGSDFATLDLTGLNSVTISNGTSIALGGNSNQGVLNLADTTVATVAPVNSITTNSLNIATTASANEPAQTSILNLGSGSNTIKAGAINLGTVRGYGILQFAADAPATASVTISDTGGGGGEVINLATESGNGPVQPNQSSQLNLAGHVANVQASALNIATASGSVSGGSAITASVTFDNGTFAVSGPVVIASDSGGLNTAGVTGTLTIGGPTPNNTATGVFSAAGITLGSFTNTNGAVSGAVANATFTLNGGSASITGNIVNASTHATTNSILNLSGGALNMNGNSIGGSGGVNSGTGPVTVNWPANGQTATLMNLGGGGVNGAGLNTNGAGLIIIDGTNTYSGNTTVSAGTMTLAATGSIPSTNVTVAASAVGNFIGTLQTTANVIANGAANFGAAGSLTASTTQLASLSVGPNSTSSITLSHDASQPKTLQPATLTFDPTNSKLDITNNILISTGTVAQAEALVTSLDPNHHVITTDTNLALGYGDAGGGNFEIRATLLGDSDLDGKVNVADLANLAGNFGKTSSQVWINGDFDYNGNVNVADLADLAGNFGKQLGVGSGSAAAAGAATPAALSADGAGGGAAAVPEPTMLGLAALGALGACHRPRRRRRRGSSDEV